MCKFAIFFFFLFIYLFRVIFFFFVCVLLAIIIKKVDDVFRNYLARMRAFDGSSSLLYFSIEVTKIVVPSLMKNWV